MLERADLQAATLEAADLAPMEDPAIQVEYTGKMETDAKAELDEVAKGFRERRDQEAKRRKKATDSEYWVCLCFQTREQVEAFLEATRWAGSDAKYIDGQQVAKKLGVKLPADDVGYSKLKKPDDRYARLALPVTKEN